MGIKTEDFVRDLPPKELTAGIDWIGILDRFDPTGLEDRYINECARRNPYETCYRWEEDGLLPEPVESRMEKSELFMLSERRDLKEWVTRIRSEGLSQMLYDHARRALIKAIGQKGAAEYNRREYERLGKEGRKRQADEYAKQTAEREKENDYADEDPEGELDWYCAPASVHEKVLKIRKGFLAGNGKPLVQRDFAKLIGYPVSKYTEAEKTDRYGINTGIDESPVEYELLDKLIMICHANPYWLFDDSISADYAEYENTDAVAMGDAPSVYTTPDIILKWICEGRPRQTDWIEGTAR